MCGICGVINCPSGGVEKCLVGMTAQQHRGPQSCGIGSCYKRGHGNSVLKYQGLVVENCARRPLIKMGQKDPQVVIGHTRYATCGAPTIENVQPRISSDRLTLVGANGDIVPSSYKHWHSTMEKEGFRPIGGNDAEVILRVIEWRLSRGDTIIESVRFVQDNVIGAFSALMIHDGQLIAFRDPHGIRPFVVGGIKNSPTRLFASETCALSAMGADDYEYLLAGEIRAYLRDGSYCLVCGKEKKHAHCIFELIYFSDPTSFLYGLSVSGFRENLGGAMVPNLPQDIDIICSVPDAANYAAIGMAQAALIPYRLGIRRSHYVGRTFIAPTQELREQMARQKHAPNIEVIKGKRIGLVDDSIVRGTTSKEIVERLLQAGAKEVHLLIVSPPVVNPCYYGIATPTRKELIAANMSTDEICKYVGATTLTYLDMDELRDVVSRSGKSPDHYCMACFGGEYPTPI